MKQSIFPDQVGSRIKRLRKQADVTLASLAATTGIAKQRLSEWECNRSHPSREQLRCLADALGTSVNYLTTESDWLPPSQKNPWSLQKIPDGFRSRYLFRHHGKHGALVRLHACEASYPTTAVELWTRISQRGDFKALVRWLYRFPLDSGLEALVVLQLLAAGAMPVHLLPGLLGFRAHPIVHPKNGDCIAHCPHPGLVLGGRVYFPQVGLRRMDGELIVVDWLVAERSGARVKWFVAEVDGGGHDASGDGKRDRNLRLNVLRFDEEACKSFLEQLAKKRARLAERLAARKSRPAA